MGVQLIAAAFPRDAIFLHISILDENVIGVVVVVVVVVVVGVGLPSLVWYGCESADRSSSRRRRRKGHNSPTPLLFSLGGS